MSNKLKKLVVLEKVDMAASAFKDLQDYAEEVQIYSDFPSFEEVHERISDADGLILSWKTKLTAEHIEKAGNLKYIGLACSFYGNESSNIDAVAAEKKNITVKGIFDYGDPGVTEFILSESIQLLNGYGKFQWKDQPEELGSQKFGIIGLGTTGKLLAKALIALGAEVYYFSRTRKKQWEKKGVQFSEIEDLVQECDLISVHLPKNTQILTRDLFDKMGRGKILINTSLGLPFEENDLVKWVKQNRNFAIFDADGSHDLSNNTIYIDGIIKQSQSAGWSRQTQERRGKKVIKNMKKYLKRG